MQNICSHGAEHADHDHREPVRRGPVGRLPELEKQRYDERHEAQKHRSHRTYRVDEKVRARLAHRRRQAFDDPEEHGDLRHP